MTGILEPQLTHVDRFGRTVPEDPVPTDVELIRGAVIGPDAFCRYPIETWVKIGGTSVNVAADGMREGAETLVDGLSFGWGRATPVDQPDTSTLSCTLRQQLFPDQPEQIHATNFYPDPSHEYGLPPWPTGDRWIDVAHTWTERDETWQDFTLGLGLDAEAHTGGRSIRFTNPYGSIADPPSGATSGSYTWTSDPLASPAEMGLDVGDPVTVTAWVNLPCATDPPSQLLGLTGPAVDPAWAPPPPGCGGWARIGVTATVADPGQPIQLSLTGGVQFGDSVLLDDLALMPGQQTQDFHGDLPCQGRTWDPCDLPAHCYRWTGQPGASWSQRYRPAYHQQRLPDLIHTGVPLEVWVHSDEAFLPGTRVIDWQAMPGAGYVADLNWFTEDPDLTAVSTSRFGRTMMWIGRATGADSTGWAPDAHIAIPPGIFQPAGLNPNAWDHIAQIEPGISWRIDLTVLVPPSARLQLAAVGFPGPYPTDQVPLLVTALPDGQGGLVVTNVTTNENPAIGDASWQWQTLSGFVQLPPDQPPVWIGIGLLNPDTGPATAPGPGTGMPDLTTWQDTPGTWADQPQRWIDYLGVGIDRATLSTTLSAGRTALVWGGQIKTVTFNGLGGLHTIEAQLTAADPSASMNNDYVGDEPWPHGETAETRITRIVGMSKDQPDTDIDTRIRPILIAFRDVDRQPVLGLLKDLANTTGAVLWPAAHAISGSFLWFEDPAERSAAWQLHHDPETGQVTIGIIGANYAGRHLITGHDLELEPIEVTQDPSQVITSVDVTWKAYIPPEEPGGQSNTEDHTENVTDADAVDQYGLQQLSIDTELTSAIDAVDRATHALTISRGSDKRIQGLVWDTLTLERDIAPINGQTRVERLNTVLDLLDGTDRLGTPAVLDELPDWVPADISRPNYIEGGTYTLENSRWVLDLNAVPAGTSGLSVTWNDMAPFTTDPNIRWIDFDPAIEWHDLYGVAAPIVPVPLQPAV